VRTWDGLTPIRLDNLILDAALNPDLSGSPILIYKPNVDERCRLLAGERKAGDSGAGAYYYTWSPAAATPAKPWPGLWLPGITGILAAPSPAAPRGYQEDSAVHTAPDYPNVGALVPESVSGYTIKPSYASQSNGAFDFLDYKLPLEDFSGGGVIEFLFKINSANDKLPNVFYYGSDRANPSERWWERIGLWRISTKELIRQRGQVTVLNNVINPTAGEKAFVNYNLLRAGQVSVQVFTLDGVLIRQLYRGSRPIGEYVDSWDGKNNGGRPVARGLYFIRVVGPGIDEIRKVMVVK
jgi:hypothetical protein